MNNSKKVNAFISYASKDKEIAHVLIDEIKKRALNSKHFDWFFWNDTEISIGDKWHEIITEKVAKSDCAILLISSNFLTSDYIKEHELKEFFKKLENDENKPFYFFPLLLRPTDIKQVPEISERQFFKPDNKDYGIDLPKEAYFSFYDLFPPNHDFKMNLLPVKVDHYINSLFKELESTINNKKLKSTNIKISEIIEKKKFNTIPTIHLCELSNIPQKNENYTGKTPTKRANKLFESLKNNKQTVKITGIQGMGGIGKSALTIEVCNKIKNTWSSENPLFKDGILWLRLEKGNPISVVLENIETQLGIILNENILERKVILLDEIFQHYDILIVIDSAEQNKDVANDLLDYFKNSPIIITSREDFFNSNISINIERLNEDDALSLFTKTFPKKNIKPNDLENLKKFFIQVGYLPLAIIIFAKIAKKKERTKTISTLYNEYKQQGVKFLTIETSGDKDAETKKNNNAKLCIKYSFEQLSESQKAIFTGTAFFTFPFTIERLKSIVKTEFEDTAIDELVYLSLIDKDTYKNTYTIHPLVKEFILNKIEPKLKDNYYNDKKIIFFGLLSKKGFSVVLDLDETISLTYDLKERGDLEYFFKFAYKLDSILNKELQWEKKTAINLETIEIAKNNKEYNKHYTHFLESYADTIGRQGKYEESIIHFNKVKASINTSKYFVDYRIYSNQYYLEEYTDSYSGNFVSLRKYQQVKENMANLSSFNKTIGWIYKDFGLHDEAYNCYLANLVNKKWTENTTDKLNFLKGVIDIAKLIYEKGNLDNALKYTQIILSQAKKHKLNENIDNLNYFLFNIYYDLNDIENAEKIAKILLDNKKKKKDDNDQYEILKGKICLLKNEFTESIAYFSKIKNKQSKDYWLIKSLLNTLSSENKDKIETINDKIVLLENKYTLESNNLQLSNIYLLKTLYLLKKNNFKQKDLLDATKYFSRSCKTKLKLGIKLGKKEDIIKKQILSKYKTLGIDEDFFKAMYNSVKELNNLPEFILTNLSETVIHKKDGKKMILIPKGNSYIGKGSTKKIDLDKILNNFNELVNELPNDENNLNKQIIDIGITPTVVDKDYFNQLLTNSISLTKEEKQRVVDAFPRLSDEQILELQKIFEEEEEKFKELEVDYEKDVSNLKKQRHFEIYGIGFNSMAKQLYLYPYYIDEKPVSVKEYLKFCKETNHPKPKYIKEFSIDKSSEKPIINVCYKDALKYAKWAEKELPTAIEWEKACRGKEGNTYPWGNEWNDAYISSKLKNSIEEINKFSKKLVKKDKFNIQQNIKDEIQNLDSKGLLKIPLHPETDFDEKYFSFLLTNSFSLNNEEKKEVLNAIPKLKQKQIDELTAIFEDEKLKFKELEKNHYKAKTNEIINYDEKYNKPIKDAFLNFIKLSIDNISSFGVKNMVGNIQEWTSTKENSTEQLVKGGGWLSEKPKTEYKGFHHKKSNVNTKNFDLGFRCVIPIFRQSDYDKIKK